MASKIPGVAQFAKIMDILDRNRYGQEIAAAWIPRRNCVMP